MGRLTCNGNINLPKGELNNIRLSLMVDKSVINNDNRVFRDVHNIMLKRDVEFHVLVNVKRRKRPPFSIFEHSLDYGDLYTRGKDYGSPYRTEHAFVMFKADSAEMVKREGKEESCVIHGTLYKRMFANMREYLVSDEMFYFICENIFCGNYEVRGLGNSTFIEITKRYDEDI